MSESWKRNAVLSVKIDIYYILLQRHSLAQNITYPDISQSKTFKQNQQKMADTWTVLMFSCNFFRVFTHCIATIQCDQHW